MKCHYTYSAENGKVLIPGCMSVAATFDMTRCTCRPETFAEFEREQYNAAVSQLRQQIKELERENARLNRMIESLAKSTAL
jgi:predicted RNase H-like nuclease (RuvC/YqgF family)